MQCKSLKSKIYSEKKFSGRFDQSRNLEARKFGKTCKRGYRQCNWVISTM